MLLERSRDRVISTQVSHIDTTARASTHIAIGQTQNVAQELPPRRRRNIANEALSVSARVARTVGRTTLRLTGFAVRASLVATSGVVGPRFGWPGLGWPRFG